MSCCPTASDPDVEAGAAPCSVAAAAFALAIRGRSVSPGPQDKNDGVAVTRGMIIADEVGGGNAGASERMHEGAPLQRLQPVFEERVIDGHGFLGSFLDVAPVPHGVHGRQPPILRRRKTRRKIVIDLRVWGHDR